MTTQDTWFIDDFLGNNCYYVTWHPRLIPALRDVLARLPESVFEERDIIVVFPEQHGSTAYLRNVMVPSASDSMFSVYPVWIIVLAGYLAESTHKVAVGTIAHEFAHVVLGHRSGGSNAEDAADTLAIEWGFSDEIEASKCTA